MLEHCKCSVSVCDYGVVVSAECFVGLTVMIMYTLSDLLEDRALYTLFIIIIIIFSFLFTR